MHVQCTAAVATGIEDMFKADKRLVTKSENKNCSMERLFQNFCHSACQTFPNVFQDHNSHPTIEFIMITHIIIFVIFARRRMHACRHIMHARNHDANIVAGGCRSRYVRSKQAADTG